MPDPRFHDRAGPFTLADLAARIGAEAQGDGDRRLTDVATVESAGEADVVYVEDKRYLDLLATSRAGACILRSEAAARAPAGMGLLVVAEPQRGFALAARAFYPPPNPVAGIAATAAVDPSARIDPTAEIASGAAIAGGATVGARTVVGPNAVIGRNVAIGTDCRIGAGASVTHAVIGDRVTLHAGVRVGQDGFGFVPGPGGHLKIPQLGRVLIEDDVDVGANSTIDRGALGDTVIGRGCLIDNLVQIGHNVRLGRGCILVGQVGISGSAVLGDFVMVGGQAGVTGHLSIGDGVRIAAKSGVMRDVPPGVTVGGAPAIPLPEFFRQLATLQRLAKKKGA